MEKSDLQKQVLEGRLIAAQTRLWCEEFSSSWIWLKFDILSPMKCLLVSDLHYKLKHFDWLVTVAEYFDCIIIAGDQIDARSHCIFTYPGSGYSQVPGETPANYPGHGLLGESRP